MDKYITTIKANVNVQKDKNGIKIFRNVSYLVNQVKDMKMENVFVITVLILINRLKNVVHLNKYGIKISNVVYLNVKIINTMTLSLDFVLIGVEKVYISTK